MSEMLKQHYPLSLSLMFSRKVMILKIGEYKNLTTSRYSRVQNYKLSKKILSLVSLFTHLRFRILRGQR